MVLETHDEEGQEGFALLASLASLAFLSYSLSVGVPSDSDSGVYHFGIIPIIPLGGS